MALSLDASVTGNTGGTSISTFAAPALTTTNANDVIILFAIVNLNAAGPISSVSDTAGLTWTARKQVTGCGGNSLYNLEEWWAPAPSALVSDVITIHCASVIGFATLTAFGVSGANTAAPFDVNVSLPASTNASSSASVSVSTTAANTMVLGGFRQSGQSSPTSGTGYTQIQGANYMLAEYQIFTSAQTSKTVTETTGSGDANGIIGDAIAAGTTALINVSLLPHPSLQIWDH
jgi:hypothetical protein